MCVLGSNFVASAIRWVFNEKNAIVLVTLFALAIFLLHVYTAFVQSDYSFVDDITYVNSAIRIVLGKQCAPLPDNICNYEHPPLAKLLMALGFEIFGRTQVIGKLVGLGFNQLGGRFFQIAMNSLSAPVLYLIVKKISGNYKMALLASVFLLIDPLYYTLSSTASLDNAMVFFAILALLPLAYVHELGT